MDYYIASNNKTMNKQLFPLMMALSIGISQVPIALAGPGDTNSVNTGTDIQGGTYYNTANSQTSFINNSTITLQPGVTARGLEVNSGGALTGNGGNFLINAPVVYIKGTMDVSAAMGSGFATSNGGTVTINSQYLYQGGNIFANGTNGGLININAGAATFAPGSNTTALGLGGAGGTILVNSSGSVDIQNNGQAPNSGSYQAALIDASGKYIGSIDTSVVNIQGSVVNVDGIVRANGYVVADGNVVHLYNEALADANGNPVDKLIPPALRPVEGTLMTTGSEGGTVRIAATGAGGEGNTGVCIAECAITKADATTPGLFAPGEAQGLIDRMTSLLNTNNGNVVIGATGKVQVDGSSVQFLQNDPLVTALGGVPFTDQPIVHKGYGEYEQAFNSGGFFGLADSVYGEVTPNFAAGQNGGVLLVNARNNFNVNTADFGGVGYGGLLSARGGNGNGYSYTGEGGAQYATFNAGNGGFINANATNDINFAGSAHAFGGNGYQNYRALNATEQAWVTSNNKNLPEGYVFDNQDNAIGGLGGNGGTIAFSYGNNFNNTNVASLNGFTLAPGFTDKTLVNYQQIDASGGHTGLHANGLIDGQINPYGGLVVFSGAQNPNNLGNVSVYRGQGPDLYPVIDVTRFGTVVLPDASNATSIAELKGSNTNFNPDATQLKIDQLHEDELLLGRDTLALLSNSNLQSTWDKVNNAIVRSSAPEDQDGGAGYKLQGIAPTLKNFVISSMAGNRLVMDFPSGVEGDSYFLADSGNTSFPSLNALMILNSARNGNSRLINKDFWVVGDGSSLSGGLISLMSDGNIINRNGAVLGVYGPYTDGAVSLATNGSIINRGYIGGWSESTYGASVILKACRDILNAKNGEIGANGWFGGKIELLANNNILNRGWIHSDGYKQGGTIFSYAGNNNYNLGYISAQGYGYGFGSPLTKIANNDFIDNNYEEGVGNGGYIHLHGKQLVANIDTGTIQGAPNLGAGYITAAGSDKGGTVILSSGEESCGVGCENTNPTNSVTGAGNQVNNFLNQLLGRTNLKGFSTTQNTANGVSVDPVGNVTVMDTFIDMTRTGGTAVNLGHIETRGNNGGGQTWLVGQGQAGVGADSSINGVTVTYDTIMAQPLANRPQAFQDQLKAMNDGGNAVQLVAGFFQDAFGNPVSALSAVLCSNLIPPNVNNSDDQGDGGGFDFPNNFTIPGGETPRETLDVNTNALFDTYRFRNDLNVPNPPAPLVIGYEQPGLFLAKAYQPVTQEILRLAMLEYNRALSDNNSATQGSQTHKRAFEMARLYLTDAGVDQETATSLLEKIQDGTFKADKNVVGVLQAIAQPEVEPTSTPSQTVPTTQPDNVLRQ